MSFTELKLRSMFLLDVLGEELLPHPLRLLDIDNMPRGFGSCSLQLLPLLSEDILKF